MKKKGGKHGLAYVYRRIDLEALGRPHLAARSAEAAERMGYNGLNITYPCKQAVIPLLDELSADARALGAVNTVQSGTANESVTTRTGQVSRARSSTDCRRVAG